jgi:hypothetical protein
MMTILKDETSKRLLLHQIVLLIFLVSATRIFIIIVFGYHTAFPFKDYRILVQGII